MLMNALVKNGVIKNAIPGGAAARPRPARPLPRRMRNGCLTAGKLWNVNGSLTFETSKNSSETTSCHQPRSGAG